MMTKGVRFPDLGKFLLSAAISPIVATANGSMVGRRNRLPTRLQVDFRDDQYRRISHEAIYQSLESSYWATLPKALAWCSQMPTQTAWPKYGANSRPYRTGCSRPAEAIAPVF